MPRFIVPRSTRTMYGTVRPPVVVVCATRSSGVTPGHVRLEAVVRRGQGWRVRVGQPARATRDLRVVEQLVLGVDVALPVGGGGPRQPTRVRSRRVAHLQTPGRRRANPRLR